MIEVMNKYAARTYRKKPVEIQALQWTTQVSKNAMLEFTNYLMRADDLGEKFFVYDRLHDTWVEFYYDDYIIKGLQGEFYPCRPDVFNESYTLVHSYATTYNHKPGMR